MALERGGKIIETRETQAIEGSMMETLNFLLGSVILIIIFGIVFAVVYLLCMAMTGK